MPAQCGHAALCAVHWLALPASRYNVYTLNEISCSVLAVSISMLRIDTMVTHQTCFEVWSKGKLEDTGKQICTTRCTSILLLIRICVDSHTCLTATQLSVHMIIKPEVHCVCAMLDTLPEKLSTIKELCHSGIWPTCIHHAIIQCYWNLGQIRSISGVACCSSFLPGKIQDGMPWGLCDTDKPCSWSMLLGTHMFCLQLMRLQHDAKNHDPDLLCTPKDLSQCHCSPLISIQALHAFWSGSSHWRSMADRSLNSLGHLQSSTGMSIQEQLKTTAAVTSASAGTAVLHVCM